MKKKIFTVGLLIFLIAFTHVSAKIPIKFGKISDEEMNMTVWDLDTTATAVILCDYGEFDPDRYEFSRTLRIKILKKDGLDWANWTFPTSEKGMVRGVTYNVVDGKVEQTKLDTKADVFRDRVYKDYYQLKVSVPNVKVGSVFDLEYTLQGLPREWQFQYTIPVKHSELVIYDNSYVTYNKNFFGFVHLDVNERNRWAAFNLPAFKIEPYMNYYKNYTTRFEIEVVKISIPQINLHVVGATSWDAVRSYLYRDPDFGGLFEGNFFLNSIAKEIASTATTDEEKIAAAVNRIKEVKWNDRKSKWGSGSSLSNVYTKKIANSAELNIMLVELLSKLDFNCKPVLISTRENGLLSPIRPSIDKLNYVLAQVTVADKVMLLDATDKYMSPFIVPEYCLNSMGRCITNDFNDWVMLKAPAADEKTMMYSLKMNTDGAIEGTFAVKRGGYAARDFRAKYYSFNSAEDYIIEFEKEHTGTSVKNYTIDGLKDTKEDINEQYEVKIDNRGMQTGSMLILNPLFDEKMSENPFKLQERKYPVDFIHPIKRTLIFNLMIPENVEVVELPKPARFNLPGNKITCLYNAVQMGNNIQIMYKFDVNVPLSNENEYPDIKELFNVLVQKHAESIILKINEPANTAAL